MRKFLTGIFVVLFSVPAFATENSEASQDLGGMEAAIVIGEHKSRECNVGELAQVNARSGYTKIKSDGTSGLDCVSTACIPEYKLTNGTCEKFTCDGPRYVMNANGDGCDDMVGRACKSSDTNAASAKYKMNGGALECVTQTCNSAYVLRGGKCIPSDGACNATQLSGVSHAVAGESKDGVCHATKCDSGYEVSDGKCVAIGGNCQPMPTGAKSGHRVWNSETKSEQCVIDECDNEHNISDDKLSCTPKPQATLNAEQSQTKVQELRENYNTQRAKEQSTTNKLIGAAGIGATGIGTQMAASALAEQRADADAERDMRAYLATFKCDYGAGRNINGGETEIELPGGNDLLPLYTEYRQLANDLKIRKDALGLKPGIESEVIFDAAETGLYDNAATGITSGTYTSLARALTNTTGTDAQNWQAQKDEAAQSLKTGATVAGVGAGASLVANLAVNSGASKQNQAGNIIAKYAPLYKLQDSVTKLSDNESGVKCPDGATGTVPECVCGTSGREYNANTNTCDAPSLEKLPDITSTATTGITGGLAQITTQNALAPRAVLPAKNLFATGKSTLTSAAQQEIKTFVANVKNATDGDSKYCITVTGHTDKTGNAQSNNTLSQNRADAVKQALISSGLASGRIRTVGRGQSECTQDGPQESCRKVEISMSDSEC